MDSNGNNNSTDDSGNGEWGGRKRRDDTPSFIRNVQARADMLNPARTGDAIPVLTMPSSVKIWRKIRWPLFVVIVLGILVAVGLFTNDRLVARRIARKVADAKTAESAATIETLMETDEILTALAERHPGRRDAQVAFAWHSVLLAEIFGPADAYMKKSSEAFGRISSDTSPMGMAALAGRKYHEGDFKGALEIADKGLQNHRDEPRLHLVRALALRALGKKEEAGDVLASLRKMAVDYVPTLHVQLAAAVEDGDTDAAGDIANDMVLISPGNLHGVLGSIAVKLPAWGAPKPSTARVAALLAELRAVQSRIADAPPKLALFGRYVSGRVALLANKLDQAREDLDFASRTGGSPEVLAWYAMAVRRSSGPADALEVLDGVEGATVPQINSLRAQCYLDYHQVESASVAIEALRENGDKKEIARLEWILAVRKADLDAAKEALPREIGADLQWVALEMYHLARILGDLEAIDAIKERFVEDAGTCAKGIEVWHEGSTSSVYALLSGGSDDLCTEALTAKLMRGHAAPDEIEKSATAAVAGSEGELFPLVDQALSVWLARGRQAAVDVLARILEKRPDGALIRIAMADAYLEMGLPADAAKVLEGVSGPLATSLKIRAAQDSGDNGLASSLLDGALSDTDTGKHPAIVYWSLKKSFDASDFDKVIKGADDIIENSGVWTSEIAELRAKAQNAMGSRGDADRGLLSAAKTARSASGIGEAWDTKLALIRLNLRRGGNFLFKAVGVTIEMYKAGVRDSELSYSYAVCNIRQGNERGAMRYLKEAVELNPSYVPPFSQLNLMGKLTEENTAVLQRTRPGASLE